MSEAREVVFLQTSDWHVGSALRRGPFVPPSPLAEERRAEMDGAPERAVAAAREAGADALLVPGDLWDAESLGADVLHRMLEAFASFDGPVFIAPGNHDFAGPGGFYDPHVLRVLGMRSWPENVHVFRDPDFRTVRFPGRDDVALTGRAFLSPAVVEERPFASLPQPVEGRLNVLMVHGSYESYGGSDRPSGKKRTAPFSRAELLASGYDWTALGHHHHLSVIEDDAGAPRAAYSGSPTGRGADECGPRYFLRVALAAGAPPDVRLVPADHRVLHELSLDVTGLEGVGLAGALVALLDGAGVSANDFVNVTFTGRAPHGARPLAALASLGTRAAHVSGRDRSRPPLPPESSLRTAEERFVTDLLARLANAEDERARRVLELALALGRDALSGRELLPPEPEAL